MVRYNVLESLRVVECKLIGCVGVSLSLKIVVHSKKTWPPYRNENWCGYSRFLKFSVLCHLKSVCFLEIS